MAARKGKGRQAVRNSKPGFPAWGFLVIGIVVGAIAVGFVTHGKFGGLNKPAVPEANPQATAQNASDQGGLEPATASSAPKKPQYDFYSVLSEKEVRIPDAEISAQARAEQQQKQQAAQTAQTAQTAQSQTAPANQVAAASATPTEQVVAAPPSTAAPTAGSGYLLQVGAFPNASDAESLKAKLAMQGLVANVQSVKLGGQVYHRVRLGPFRSATALESTKQQLAHAGIPAIALKEGN